MAPKTPLKPPQTYNLEDFGYAPMKPPKRSIRSSPSRCEALYDVFHDYEIKVLRAMKKASPRKPIIVFNKLNDTVATFEDLQETICCEIRYYTPYSGGGRIHRDAEPDRA